MLLNILGISLEPPTFHAIKKILSASKRHTIRFVQWSPNTNAQNILFELEWHLVITENPTEEQLDFLKDFKQSEVFSHIPIVFFQEHQNITASADILDFFISPRSPESEITALFDGIIKSSTQLNNLRNELLDKKETIINNYILIDLLSGYLSTTTVEVARKQAVDQILTTQALTQQVTILFLDICSFTKYSTSHNTQKIIEFLNDLYSLIVPIIKEYKGDIDKFVGDGCLVVFKEARDALQSILHIFNTLKYHCPPHLSGTALHAGIHTGEVIRCRVGGDQRFDYTLIGKVVNIASKLQAHATQHDILVSKETLQAAKMDVPEKEFRSITLDKTNTKVRFINIFRLYEKTKGKLNQNVSRQNRPEKEALSL